MMKEREYLLNEARAIFGAVTVSDGGEITIHDSRNGKTYVITDDGQLRDLVDANSLPF